MNETRESKGTAAKTLDIFVLCLAVGLGVFQLYSAVIGTWTSYVLAAVHWGFIGVYIVIRHPTKVKFGWVYDMLIAAATIYMCYYQVALQKTLITSAGIYTLHEVVLSVLAMLLAMEVARRVVGNILPLIAILFVVYALLGSHVPGVLKTVKFSMRRIAPFIFTSSDGLFGQTLYVSAQYIFLFILFGSILQLTGAGEFFVDLAYAAVGKARGGPAQAAIYSSMLMGTINGSGAANVVTTGTFTIPLMKKVGLKPSTAGAVEAVASSGGQIMPPVMGAVAFLMAEVTGIQYSKIALAALVPACLYYMTLSASIYFTARRDNIKAADSSEIKRVRDVLKNGWLYLAPLVILIYLLVSGQSAQRAAFFSILVALAVGFIMNRHNMTFRNLGEAFKNAIDGIAPVASACILAGIIMGVISMTGLGLKLSGIITAIAGGRLFVALLLAMIASLLLGMGLPTSAAYIVLAVLVAPALVDMGVSKLAAHLFLLYFGALSTITPPVALSTFAAAGISGAGVWETGRDALKLASTGFIIPFIFAYDNSLLLQGSGIGIFLAIITAVAGCFVLAMAVSGWMIKNLHIVSRVLLAGAAILLIISNPVWLNIVGLVLAVAVIIAEVKMFRKK